MVKAVLIPLLALAPQPVAVLETAAVVCVVEDSRISELSGLVATADGYIAINDSNWDASATRIFYLDPSCAVTRSVKYPTAARDPEDLAITKNGTLWIADVGDNFNAATRRQTVALWRLGTKDSSPVIFRFTYPDGPHDAEALLLDGAGQPLIITKELDGAAGVYAPSRKPEARTAEGVPLVKVGTVKLPGTTTPNPWGAVGRRTITGAAASRDGRYVTLRTYADAFEWQVDDGDVLKAITSTEPTVTALPDEPQGEAIAYTVDGTGYLTVSDQPGPVPLLRYPVPPRPSPKQAEQGEQGEQGEQQGAQAREPVEHANAGVIGISAIALLIFLGALGAIWRSRRG